MLRHYPRHSHKGWVPWVESTPPMIWVVPAYKRGLALTSCPLLIGHWSVYRIIFSAVGELSFIELLKTACFAGSGIHNLFLPAHSEACLCVKMAVAGFYRRSLPSPPAIDFSSQQGKVFRISFIIRSQWVFCYKK